jgi:hypothetical protein
VENLDFRYQFLTVFLQTVKQASDLQDSVSKILHLDNKLEQDEMEGVEEEEWVRFQKHFL